MTAALGALLLSTLVAQATGPSDLDGGARVPNPLGVAADGGAPADGPAATAAPAPSAAGSWQPPHYDEGFVLVSTPDSAPLPYLLRLNHVSQFKYTNTMAVHAAYLTHLGEVKDVNKRNDFQLTRDVFYFRATSSTSGSTTTSFSTHRRPI